MTVNNIVLAPVVTMKVCCSLPLTCKLGLIAVATVMIVYVQNLVDEPDLSMVWN